MRKQAGSVLRDAAERFCKEVLVKDRRAKGENQAMISDYDGRNLGYLCPRVEPLLVANAADPGKLRAVGATLNPANHDDDAPASGALKVSFGDLRALTKAYLGRG